MPGNDFCAGLKVVDIGVGMAPTLLARMLGDAGASVMRIEPPGGDPFYDVYPAYNTWQQGKTILSGEDVVPSQWASLLADADICVLGGEDYPGLSWSHDAAALSARYPRQVVVDIRGYPGSAAEFPGRAVDMLVGARSGLAFQQYSDRPLLGALPLPTYGAITHGLAGTLAAIYERERSGRGQVVTTSLLQGALSWVAHLWFEFDADKAPPLGYFPRDIRPLMFRTADGAFIHFSQGTPGAPGKINAILGIDTGLAAADREIGGDRNDGAIFFSTIADQLAERVAGWNSDELMAALLGAGISAELVLPPGACWDDPQVVLNGAIVVAEDGTRFVRMPIHVTGPDNQPIGQLV